MDKEIIVLQKFIGLKHRFNSINRNMIMHDNSHNEFVLMQMIHYNKKCEKEFLGVSEIAKNMRISLPAVSRLLKTMEEKDLIERITQKDNRRNTNVLLTKKGNETRRKLEKRAEEFFKDILNRVGLDKVESMLEIWEEMLDAMQEITNEKK